MHNLYYKGSIDTRLNHVKSGFNVDRTIKRGTEKRPLALTVGSEIKKREVEAIVAENGFYANIIVDSAVDEDINELNSILSKPKAIVVEKKPNRNDPCLCDSGKKYKKCCGF